MSRPSDQLVQLLWNGEYQQIISLVNKTLQAGNETSDQLTIVGVALHHQGLQSQAMEAFLLAGQKNPHINLIARDLIGLEELLYLSHPSLMLPFFPLEADQIDNFRHPEVHQSLAFNDLMGFLLELIEAATLCCLLSQPRLAIRYFQQYRSEKSALEFRDETTQPLHPLQQLEQVFYHSFSHYFDTSAELVLSLGTMKELLECIDEDEKAIIHLSLEQSKLSGNQPNLGVLGSTPFIEPTLDLVHQLPNLDKQAFVYLLGHEDLLTQTDLERMNKAHQYI